MKEQRQNQGNNAWIQYLQAQTGVISDPVRAVLITDGSVTRLLECFGGADVSIHTLKQQVIPAENEIADCLNVKPGEPVNYRSVHICDTETGIPLIHAISYCPINRLPSHAREKLMQADIPIGHILIDEKMESRREILAIRPVNPCDLPTLVPWREPSRRILSRTYRIIHQQEPIFRIEEFIPADLFSNNTGRVTIRTPSRLHLALIDMNGSLGRVDGGVGIALDRPGFVLTAEPSEQMRVIAPDEQLKEKVETLISTLSPKYGYQGNISVSISEQIPPHSGLGSGTQLALAVATTISLISGIETSDPARLTGRGGTSGVGIRAFENGGIIVDAGHRFGPGQEKDSFIPSSAATGVRAPPLIGRYEFPDDWRIILCLPHLPHGANGAKETDFFHQTCPVPLPDVEKVSHIVLMQMIPALIEQDLDQFGQAVSAIQQYGFKKSELSLQPPTIHEILTQMESTGVSGAGMSSFGPALYGFCDTDGQSIASEIQGILDEQCGGEVCIVRGNNSGATIRHG